MTAALENIWVPLFPWVQAGLSVQYMWRPAQYRIVLKSLLSSKYHAVPVTEISDKLEPNGMEAVDAMVKEKLLTYRPCSGW